MWFLTGNDNCFTVGFCFLNSLNGPSVGGYVLNKYLNFQAIITSIVHFHTIERLGHSDDRLNERRPTYSFP